MSGRVNPKIGEPPTPWSFDSAFLWNEIRNIVQETGIKTISMEEKGKKSKMAVCGGLTNSCEKNRVKKQRRKGKI